MSAEIDGKVLTELHGVLGREEAKRRRTFLNVYPAEVLWGSFVAYSCLPHGHFSGGEK